MSLTVPLLLLWGTLVGLDLVTALQIMIARPLVAGCVAGIILGDPLSGGLLGIVLELFALDVLPVGAARYPDYGLGAVAGAVAIAGAPSALGVGVALAVALVIAWFGGAATHFVRRRNAHDLRRHAAAIDEGDARVVAAVHYRSLARDTARTFVVTAIGLVVAQTARLAIPSFGIAVFMTVAALGAALAAAVSGGMQLSGRGLDLRWFVLGLAAGTAWVALA
jgi:mannose/fructose/N-acetylgalactosamine-specific phosphotransferase system component IIC